MLGIDFVKKPVALATSLSGMEFMDYQDPEFYNQLVAFYETIIEHKDGEPYLREDKEVATMFNEFVLKRTGMNILLHVGEDVGNAAVDVGYFNPSNLLNSKGIEQFMHNSESTIGKAFKALKVDCLRGWVDTSKAMVGGDFSKVEINLYIQKHVGMFLREKYLLKNKTTLPEALATITLHELGHAFTGFLYISKTVIDSLLPFHAIKLITDGGVYGLERTKIIKETSKFLEIYNTSTKDSDFDKMEPEDILVYFEKGIANRDVRRTLSLGTQDRASEVYADLYAIRFGAPKSLVAGLIALPDYTISPYFLAALYGLGFGFGLTVIPSYLLLGCLLAPLLTLIKIQVDVNPSDIYDSPYRRIKNILRDTVIRLNSDKSLPNKDKARMLADAKAMEKMIEESKPGLEGTGVQRLVGWLFSGSDFKLQEYEHYTEELLAHSISLYKNSF